MSGKILNSSVKCMYANCFSSNRYNNDLTFFKFPVSNIEQTKKWQINSGNINIINMKIEQLKTKRICELHFLEKDISRNNVRKLLSKTAVPVKFGEEEDSDLCDSPTTISTDEENMDDSELATSLQYYISQNGNVLYASPALQSTSNLEVSEHASGTVSPRESLINQQVQAFTYKINNLKKKVITKQEKAKKMKKQFFSVRNVVNDLMKHRSKFMQTFITMQLFHTKSTKWTVAERQLALSLYYKSPGAYKFLLQSLKFVLPPIKTIQKWLKVTDFRTGLNASLVNKLSLKCKAMTSLEKTIVVMFKEMALKPHLEYNKHLDIIEGYDDLGCAKQRAKLADTALIFLIRGLHVNWKLPLCFYASAGPLSSVALARIITDIIKKLDEMSFNPLVLVCDKSLGNWSALELLGATKDKPIINVAGREVFTMYDVPRLLINLRDNFMSKNLRIWFNNIAVAWTDIIETYEADKKSMTSRAMVKITDAHISPTDIQRTRVKYASQIFSHTVAVAIKTAWKLGENKSSTALTTAEFIGKINNIFDVLTTTVAHDPNPYRKPLSIYNTHTAVLLENALEFFKGVEITESDTFGRDVHRVAGFEWTIQSILLLWEHLKQSGVKYLFTGYLNQGPLENVCSVIRNRGSNPTPTVKQCGTALRDITNIRLQMNVEMGYYEIQDSEVLTIEEGILYAKEKTLQSCVNRDRTQEACSSKSDDTIIPGQDNPSLQVCSPLYLAAYLASRVEKKFHCPNCGANLTGSDERLVDSNELLLLSEDYDLNPDRLACLLKPTRKFCNVVMHLLNLFNLTFRRTKFCSDVSRKIRERLESNLCDNFPWDWCKTQLKCKEHRQYMVAVLVKMKINRDVKWETVKLQGNGKSRRKDSQSGGEPFSKVRILGD